MCHKILRDEEMGGESDLYVISDEDNRMFYLNYDKLWCTKEFRLQTQITTNTTNTETYHGVPYTKYQHILTTSSPLEALDTRVKVVIYRVPCGLQFVCFFPRYAKKISPKKYPQKKILQFRTKCNRGRVTLITGSTVFYISACYFTNQLHAV